MRAVAACSCFTYIPSQGFHVFPNQNLFALCAIWAENLTFLRIQVFIFLLLQKLPAPRCVQHGFGAPLQYHLKMLPYFKTIA